MIKKNIPNAITCGNLLCGCLAIVKCFSGDLVWAAYLVGIAAILDFFDGFAARLLKVTSPIGKDLDSLADMVTFGVVPGVMMFQLLHISVFSQPYLDKTFIDNPIGGLSNYGSDYLNYIPFFAFIITIFSAIRLAKFNNDTRQSETFIGLPTPANAILICSIPLFVNTNVGLTGCFGFPYLQHYILNPIFLGSLSIALSFLLIAPIHLFALKFKHFKWQGNQLRYVFLSLTILLLITLQFIGIPLIIVMYVLLSVLTNKISNPK